METRVPVQHTQRPGATGRCLRLRRRSAGFTLIEAAMTTVIVGVGFVAMLQLLTTGTATNIQSAATTTGLNLARNVREMTLEMPYNQLGTLNGKTYSPAVDNRGNALTDFADWSQQVTVQAADPDGLTRTVVDATPAARRITVTVTRNGEQACSVSWYVFDGTP